MEADYESLYLKFMLKELYNSKYSTLMVTSRKYIYELNYTVCPEINQFI